MITNMLCTNIFTDEAKEVINFYNKILNIPILKSDIDDFGGVYLGFDKRNPLICVWDSKKSGSIKTGKNSFVFHCDSLDDAMLDINEKGVLFEKHLKSKWGTYELRLNDPIGNEVILVECLRDNQAKYKTYLEEFPEFMKHIDNKIDSSQQNTSDIEGYFFEGKDGCQMAYWTSYADRESKPHKHNFDEYTVCVSGEYISIIDGKEIVLHAGDELFVPKGVEQGGKIKAGTRTLHAFGGKRINQD